MSPRICFCFFFLSTFRPICEWPKMWYEILCIGTGLCLSPPARTGL